MQPISIYESSHLLYIFFFSARHGEERIARNEYGESILRRAYLFIIQNARFLTVLILRILIKYIAEIIYTKGINIILITSRPHVIYLHKT